MRRLTAWIGGAVGGVAAYRWLRRRPEGTSEPPDDRAEELRAKLAESRGDEPAEPVVEEPAAEPVAEEVPAAEPESPEDRRRRVHEEGRSALGEMKSE
jgi:hypothetical protein